MTLEEAKAYLRIEIDAEDGPVQAAVNAARDLCEAFVGGPLVRRVLAATIPAAGTWQRLDAAPVWAIGAVETVDATGVAAALPADAYAIDIDSRGDGWVRARGRSRVRVTYEAGIAADAAAVPAPLAQGVIRLAAHLYTMRDTDQAPPAAVTALWRPWRRIRLDQGTRRCVR